MNPQSRIGYLGGSDAAAVLGISPWKSRYQLWCEKTGAEPAPDLSDIDYIYFGSILEPIVASEFERRLKKKVRMKRALVYHAKQSFIAGHVDRIVLNEDALLECKTSNAFDYRMWGEDGGDHTCIPVYYLAQIDHYMLVTGRSRTYLATLIGGHDFRCFIIERNEARERKLYDALCAFWNLIVTDDPPEIESEQDARKRWKDVVQGTSVPVDLATRAKILRLSKVQDDLGTLDKEKDALRDEIFPLFQDKELLADASNGEPLARLTLYQRTSFDKKAFEKKHPKTAAKFTESKPTKRFSVLI